MNDNITELERELAERKAGVEATAKRLVAAKKAKRVETIATIRRLLKEDDITLEEIQQDIENERNKRAIKPPTNNMRPPIFRDPKTNETSAKSGSWRKWIQTRLNTGIAFEDLVIAKGDIGKLRADFEAKKAEPEPAEAD